MAHKSLTGEQKLLIQGGTYPHYLPSGHLVYLHMATLMAVPFDPVRLQLKGAPAPVIEGVMPTPSNTGPLLAPDPFGCSVQNRRPFPSECRYGRMSETPVIGPRPDKDRRQDLELGKTQPDP